MAAFLVALTEVDFAGLTVFTLTRGVFFLVSKALTWGNLINSTGEVEADVAPAKTGFARAALFFRFRHIAPLIIHTLDYNITFFAFTQRCLRVLLFEYR